MFLFVSHRLTYPVVRENHKFTFATYCILVTFSLTQSLGFFVKENGLAVKAIKIAKYSKCKSVKWIEWKALFRDQINVVIRWRIRNLKNTHVRAHQSLPPQPYIGAPMYGPYIGAPMIEHEFQWMGTIICSRFFRGKRDLRDFSWVFYLLGKLKIGWHSKNGCS